VSGLSKDADEHTYFCSSTWTMLIEEKFVVVLAA
jgi:hypothetical protein